MITETMMTPKQLRNALDKLQISQMELGRIIGTEGRVVRRWVAADARIPMAAILVRLMLDGKITPEDVRERCKAKPRHYR